MEMAQRRLLAEVGARCFRVVGSLADRLDGHQEMDFHGLLMGEDGLVGQ